MGALTGVEDPPLLRGCRRAGESCLEPKRAPYVEESYLFTALKR